MNKNYLEYNILNNEVFIVSDETDYGRNTIAILPTQYYYLGDEAPNLFTAIFAYQESANYELTQDELTQVMTDNGFVGTNNS
jgi:hypothetical protein